MNGNVVVMKSSNCDAYEEMISDKSYTDDLFIHLLGKHRRCLMEHECKEILESIGVKTTGIQIALSEEDTVKISENIGYPVVMKIASPDVVHKSDLGGVKLNVQNDQEAGKAYRELVETFKNKSDQIIAKTSNATTAVEKKDNVAETSVAKLFEEVKIMFDDLPSRIERRVDPEFRRRKMRFHPMMMEELLHMSKEGIDPHIPILMVLSFYKNDFPWIYEIGSETLKLLQTRRPIEEIGN